jgi:hypothetical protein
MCGIIYIISAFKVLNASHVAPVLQNEGLTIESWRFNLVQNKYD